MDTGEGNTPLEVCDSMASFKPQFQALTAEDQLSMISELLMEHATKFYRVTVPKDFLQSSLMSMQHLDSSGKVNVLYELAKGLGTLRPDSTEPLFPITRMPFGLMQYMVTFFNSTPGTHVSSVLSCMRMVMINVVRILCVQIAHPY